MSMFGQSGYRWRETYFVLFRSHNRPKLKTVEQALAALGGDYRLENLRSDSSGYLESLTVISPDDFAAMDVCYTSGPEVLEQGASLAQELGESREAPEQRVQEVAQCDARFDVLHFERVPDLDEEEADEEMFDPTALLLVLGTLARLTGGIAVDPQAGAMLDE